MLSGTNKHERQGGDIQRPGFFRDHAQSGKKKHSDSDFDISSHQLGRKDCRKFWDYFDCFRQRKEI
jgi:hypothetical protein